MQRTLTATYLFFTFSLTVVCSSGGASRLDVTRFTVSLSLAQAFRHNPDFTIRNYPATPVLVRVGRVDVD